MRFCLSLAILLALPCVAHAEQTRVVRPEIKPAIEAKVPAATGRVLDLGFDPAVAADQRAGPAVTRADGAPRGHDAKRRFSLGLDIKTRREMGSAAARAAAEEPGPPTLADKIESIVERSSIGLTGTYRF